MSIDSRFETEEYKKKRAAHARKTQRDKELAVSDLTASAKSKRLQSRTSLTHLQSFETDTNGGSDVENDATMMIDDTLGMGEPLSSKQIRQRVAQKTSELSEAQLLKTPVKNVSELGGSAMKRANFCSDDALDEDEQAEDGGADDDLDDAPRRLISPLLMKQRRNRQQLRKKQRVQTNDLIGEAHDGDEQVDDDGFNDENEQIERPVAERVSSEPLEGSVIDGQDIDREDGDSSAHLSVELRAAIDARDSLAVARLSDRNGILDKPGQFDGLCSSNNTAHLPVLRNNKELMALVQTRLGWPSIFHELCTEEAMWLIDYLENLWCMRTTESIARSSVQKRRQAHKRREQMMARIESGGAVDDNDSDNDVDDENAENGDGDGGEDNTEEHRTMFGPGNFRSTRMRHTVEEVRNVDVVALARARFNVAPNAPYIDFKAIDELAQGMHSYIQQINAILLRHRERDLLLARDTMLVIESANPGERTEAFLAALSGKLPNVDNRLKFLHQHVKNARALLYSIGCMKDPHVPRDLPLELKIMGLASGDVNTSGKLLEPDCAQTQIRMRLGECQQNRWKRFDNSIYEEILIGAYHTQAYVKKMTILQLVWQQPDPFSEKQEWLRGTKKNTVDAVYRYLCNATHTTDYLPELKRDRHQWSFTNGIYTAADDKFWEYGKTYDSPNCPFNRDSVSAKFFPLVFPPALVQQRGVDIVVSSVTRIFEAQQWPEDVITWVWALFGRMFYTVGEHDNWQVAPYFKGLAGTGKSTIVEMFQRVYEPSNVGVLSNNMEEKFGLQTHYDKFIVLGPECRQNFRLDQADFQTMISGERMSIARKNLDTVEQKWTAPIMLAGNLYPRWADSGGSVSRRMIPLLFAYPVPEERSAPDLQALIDKEMPLIIVKSNKLYRAMYRAFCKQNIWNVLPPTLKKNRMQMKQETDTVAEFLQSCVINDNDPEQCISIQEFFSAYSAWGAKQHYKLPHHNAASVKQELVQQFRRCATIVGPDGTMTDVVYGISLPVAHSGFAGSGGGGGIMGAASSSLAANGFGNSSGGGSGFAHARNIGNSVSSSSNNAAAAPAPQPSAAALVASGADALGSRSFRSRVAH